MFEFEKLYTESEKETMIEFLVSSIADNKISYEEAISLSEVKLTDKMSNEALEDLIEHIAVDHTNYYIVAEKVANILLKRFSKLNKDAFEELLVDYDITRYDLPDHLVKEHLNHVEFSVVN